MNLLFLGMTLSVIGKGMLALGVVWVHITMANERSIDDLVVKSFRTELVITILGFILILAGYIIEISAFGGFSQFSSCEGAECAALITGAVSQ
jgi:uncharacterized membrane protein